MATSRADVLTSGRTTSPLVSASGSHEAHKSSQPRVRRRNRVINSCLECRRRKLKCDKEAPCTNCARFKRDCLYLAPSQEHGQRKLAQIKDQMGALEKILEREVANQQTKARDHGANGIKLSMVSVTHPESEEENDAGAQDEEGLEPTALAALDIVYEDNPDDELIDLGVQMGKMRITERVGGWIRPKLADQLTNTLQDTQGEDAGRLSSLNTEQRQKPWLGQAQAKIKASPKSYIGPGPDYIAPASSFFFPGTNMDTTLVDHLPARNVADQLINQYFEAVHPVAKVLHRQTFEAQYSRFWGQISVGTEPAPWHQSIVFAAMFSAAVSMSDDQVGQLYGTSKPALIDSLRSGTEMTLSKANFLRTTKTDTIQALVMYLIPLIRSEISRAHSVLVGTAIRLAECLGLHRDGALYNMTALEVHVRRMVWHQLCFLDLKTAEQTGPRPAIRRDDYDTKLPLNVDDADFLEPSPPTEDKSYWTDMTLTKIRLECYELRRTLFFDIIAIDKQKKSLTSTIVKIEKTRSALYAKYLPMMSEFEPQQILGQHILELIINSCFVQVLHRYLSSTSQKMPDRLRQILIEAGVTHLENAVAAESKPELATWAWYKGAYSSFHIALLLLVEVYGYPMRKYAARIWACLDYIFEMPSHLAPKQKAELIITDLRDRMEVYGQIRKLRMTKEMEERVQSLSSSSDRESSGLSPFADSPRITLSSNEQVKADVSAPAQLQAEFSSPPLVPSGSSMGNNQPGHAAAAEDVSINAMDDIDWAEWDRYFPVDQNAGDLNIPDFNMTDFTGDYGTMPAQSSNYASSMFPDLRLPNFEDLSDVNFEPMTYYAAKTDDRGNNFSR